MNENVIVLDENGNELGKTWSRRAKSLIKNGRARSIDENKIMLTRPPDTYTEDKIMSQNINSAPKDDNFDAPTSSVAPTPESAAKASPKKQFSYEIAARSYQIFAHSLIGRQDEASMKAMSDMFNRLFMLDKSNISKIRDCVDTWGEHYVFRHDDLAFNYQKRIELQLDPSNTLHNELSRALSGATENPPEDFKERTKVVFKVVEIAKRVINE